MATMMTMMTMAVTMAMITTTMTMAVTMAMITTMMPMEGVSNEESRMDDPAGIRSSDEYGEC